MFSAFGKLQLGAHVMVTIVAMGEESRHYKIDRPSFITTERAADPIKRTHIIRKRRRSCVVVVEQKTVSAVLDQ
jgi:hypothetical protein